MTAAATLDDRELLLAVYTGEGLPAGWERKRWWGDEVPHIERRWGPPDPERPHHVQRRCWAYLYPSGLWNLVLDDGPRQYPGFRTGEPGPLGAALAAVEAAAAELMAEPVAYPRKLRP